jgi:putative transposase
MNLIDEQFTKMPFYGVPRMTAYLKRLGHKVGEKRVRRLMRQMGLIAIYPKPKTSRKHPEHKVYPYLLRDVVVSRPNQVWAADITYIRLLRGFAYLVAIIDWFSRYVLAWRLSNTLEAGFCIECLEEAAEYGNPEIFNTDQGSQFTSAEFTKRLADKRIAISMDGRGRVFDNIFVERLWRSVKYENVYIKGYQTIPEAKMGLAEYFKLYNTERLHEALNYQTPWEVYSGLGRLDLLLKTGILKP